jgi:2-oxoacid:acceptor oxidoreductase gamma subunit (pyruvate/2-ketoisovalerate family)
MLGIRFHGRGGQGAVMASKILAKAYFRQGLFVQAFPAFGMERRGAPVAAYVRINAESILERGEIANPDVSVVLDPVLLEMVDVTEGLAPNATVILNDSGAGAPKSLGDMFNLAAVDASGIAVRHGLGSKLAPIVNTVVLGAFARVVENPEVELDHLLKAIEEDVPVKPDRNAAAAREAFENVSWLRRR